MTKSTKDTLGYLGTEPVAVRELLDGVTGTAEGRP